MPESLKVWHAAPELSVISCQTLLVSVFRGQGDPTQVRWLTRQVLREYGQAGRRLDLVVVLEASTPRPTPEMRTAVQDFYRQSGPYLQTVAQVVEAGGLTASAIRGILRTLNLLSNRTYDSAAFSNVEAAANWLQRQQRDRAQPITAALVCRAVDTARSHITVAENQHAGRHSAHTTANGRQMASL